jgi:CTP:molybdopterin cytidylyltransferase MocA
MGEVAAIVLAAGYSSRMPSFKPLLRIGDRTFLERAVGAFTSVGIDDVTVVTGHRGDQVGEAAERLGARAVFNPHFDRGMYSSVQAGVAALSTSVRRFFLLPVDCPLVRPETVGRIARAGAACEADIVLPARGEATGHPPLLSARLRDAILAADPPGGLRSVLAGFADRTTMIELDDPGVAVDADTWDDLIRLREAARREGLPSEERCREVLRGRTDFSAVASHSFAVAAVATALTTALNERGQHLCLPLVVSAALLHDVARDRPRHAEAGAALIDDLGYPRVAAVVRRHVDLGRDAGGDVGEAEVVYLADKLVLGDRLVTVEERFADRMRRLTGDPDGSAAARRRMDSAIAMRERLERVLGRRLDEMRGRSSSRACGRRRPQEAL